MTRHELEARKDRSANIALAVSLALCTAYVIGLLAFNAGFDRGVRSAKAEQATEAASAAADRAALAVDAWRTRK